MALLDNITANIRALETRMPTSIQGNLPLSSNLVMDWLSGPKTVAGANITADIALRITAVWACIRVISEDVASLPMIIYRRLPSGGGVSNKERVPDHPVYRLLHNTPNPWMTAMQFRETLQGHMLLWGNAYAYIDREDDGRPRALWPLMPNRMERPVESGNGTLLYSYQLPSGEPRSLTQSEVLHLRGLSGDGIMGYSPIAYHRETLGLSQAALEFGSRFFANDSRPGGVLQAKQRLSNEAANRLRTSWESAHRGLEAAHRIAVLEEGIEWKQVGMPPEDAQFLETRNFQVQDIAARIYRIPPHKIGELSRATFANIEEQALEYVTDTLRTWLVRWEQQVNKDLLLPREQGTYYTEHLMDAVLRGSIFNRFTAYQLAIQSGIYSPNEIRAFENQNPYEGGDTHLQMANMVPFGTLPKEPEPPPAAARMILTDLERTAEGYRLREREDNGQ